MISLQERLQFNPVSIDDAAGLIPILQNSGYTGCEFAFSTLYMWRHMNHNSVARWGDAVFFRSDMPSPVFSAPVGGDFGENISLLRSWAHRQGIPLVLYGSAENLTGRLQQIFPGEFSIVPSPPDHDYLYNTSDLAELPGKKYHAKRNHIAAFSRQYDWRYEPIGEDNLPQVLKMAQEWYRTRQPLSDGLLAEQEALGDVLRHREILDVRGGLIRVEGRVAAFTFGAPVSPLEFDVQVEKALPAYPGAYAVINREFAARELSSFQWINRENDVGVEGLRRAKQSYHPVRLIEKYLCTEIGFKG